MKVAFVWQGQRYEAERIRPGTKSVRVGWLKPDVPPALATCVEPSLKRLGWMTKLLPLTGPEAVTVEFLPKPKKSKRSNAMALGVRTAELSRELGLFIRENGYAERLQVICSHRGLYQGAAEARLTDAGVVLRQIAFFIGDDHSFNTKAGVSDIAVATKDASRRVVLFIEIEESGSGTKPKAIIGDALLPALADRVDLRGDDGGHFSLSLDAAQIWVGYHPRKGYDVSRTDRLESKLNEFLRKASGITEEADTKRIRLFNSPPEQLYRTLLADAKALLVELTSQTAN